MSLWSGRGKDITVNLMKRVIFPAVVGLLMVSCKRQPMISETPPNGVGSETEPDTKEYVLANEDLSHLVGKSLDEVSTEHIYEAVLAIKSGNSKPIPGSIDTATSRRTWTQYLAPDKVVQTFISEKSRTSEGIAGPMETGPTKDSPMSGKTVSILKEEGHWTATLSEEEATGEIQKTLDTISNTFNRNDDLLLYGSQPRRVGDEWEADFRSMGGDTAESGTVKVRFVRTEEFQGEHCGVFVVDIDLKGKRRDGVFTMDKKGTAEIKRSLDNLVDLSLVLNGTVEMERSPQSGIVITGSGKQKVEITRKLVLPEPVQ